MIRCSSLPLAKFCPGSIALNRNECDRVATVSSAWHAIQGQQADAQTLMARLTPEEREDVEGFGPPKDLCIFGLAPLLYANARHEIAVGLTENVRAVAYEAGTLSQGTADAYWVVATDMGKLLVLADLKMSRMNVLGGPNSLQLKAYAIGLSDVETCDGYMTALYGAVEQSWELGETVWLDSPQFLQDKREVIAAATGTDSGYVRGAHCLNCYSRLRCPAWETRIDGETIVAPESGSGMLSLLLRAKSLEDQAKRIKDMAEAWVEQKGPIRDEATGKVFRWVESSGRKSLNAEAVKALTGENFASCYKQGAAYRLLRWTR